MGRARTEVDFYREKQKRRYLEQCKYEETTKEQIETAFRGASPVEKFYEKDLSEFTQQEVIYLLKKMGYKTRTYLRVVCSYFRDYYDWCLSERLITDVDNKYVYAKIEIILENIIPHDSLQERHFNGSKFRNEYLQNIYAIENKFIAYAMFIGICGVDYEELINLKLSDLNENEKTVNLITDRIVKVDDLFIKLMKDTDFMEYYDEDGNLYNSTNRRTDFYEYIQNGYVLKQLKRGTASPVSKDFIKKRVAVIKKQSENSSLTASVIYRNGLLDFIKNSFEENGLDLTISEIFTTTKEGKRSDDYYYMYSKEIEECIEEFGASIEFRALKYIIKDFLYCFDEK